MLRRSLASLALLLTAFGLASAQPPKPATPPTKLDPTKPVAPPTLDEIIAQAVQNHPDIKAAEAKRALAEAEVEQAKFAVIQKITTANAKVEQAKEALEIAKVGYDAVMKHASVSLSERLDYQAKLSTTKAALANAELELKNAKGPATSTVKDGEFVYTIDIQDMKYNLNSVNRSIIDTAQARITLMNSEIAKPHDALDAALAQTIQLDFKATRIDEALAQMLKAKPDATIVVRSMRFDEFQTLAQPPMMKPAKGEYPLSTWLQLLIDDLNAADLRDYGLTGKFEIYVRDYGLLIAPTANAPKDAITLATYTKAKAVAAKK